MRTIPLVCVSLPTMVLLLLPAAPARAQIIISYLSGATGGGTACTRTAPCGNLFDAAAAAEVGGTVVCLDSADYGGTPISKSLTIDCTGTASSMGMDISGSGTRVTVRNVRFDTGYKITFQSGASLVVENCLFGFTSSSAPGLLFDPQSAGAQLVVTNSVFDNDGSGSAGGGIVINPQAGGSAVVSLDHVTIANNVFGVVADGSRSTAGINMTIANSTVHRNSQDGIVATTIAGQAPIGLTVKNTRSLSNNIGIRATGPGVTVRADSATVIGNATGLVVNNGAALLSAGNNMVEANGVNGAFSGPVALK